MIYCKNFIAVWHATAHNSWILNHFPVQTHLIELLHLAADVLRIHLIVWAGLQKFNFTHCYHKDMMVQEILNLQLIHNILGYWWSLDGSVAIDNGSYTQIGEKFTIWNQTYLNTHAHKWSKFKAISIMIRIVNQTIQKNKM